MPKYQMYFKTMGGEVRHVVQIDDTETLDDVLNDLLFQLRDDDGAVLAGEGEPQVIGNGEALDFSIPLREQGIRPNDVLRVSLIAPNG